VSTFGKLYWSGISVWLAFWLVVGSFNAFRQYQLENSHSVAMRSKPIDIDTIEAINSISKMHAGWIETSLLMAIFWTVPAMIAMAAGRFVYALLSRKRA
jgi:hypothetical protein